MREIKFQQPQPPPGPPQDRFCADCGAKINPKAEICPKCGVRQFNPNLQPAKPQQRYQPNRIVAGLLAIIWPLGGLGIHKFYMGYSGKGLLYMLFAITFIPAIIAFFSGIGYLLMSDEAFEEKYWH